MSNIIRFNHPPSSEKKIIQTKKIETRRLDVHEKELDPAQQKQQLLHEVEALEAKYAQLQMQLGEEQENARSEIDRWWTDKQEEAEQHAQRLAEEASTQGFQAGFDQGQLQAEEEFRQKRLEMNELIQSAYEEK